MDETKKYYIELKIPRKGAAIFDALQNKAKINRDTEQVRKATDYINNRLKDEFGITDTKYFNSRCAIAVALTDEQAKTASGWFWVKSVYTLDK